MEPLSSLNSVVVQQLYRNLKPECDLRECGPAIIDTFNSTKGMETNAFDVFGTGVFVGGHLQTLKCIYL